MSDSGDDSFIDSKDSKAPVVQKDAKDQHSPTRSFIRKIQSSSSSSDSKAFIDNPVLKKKKTVRFDKEVQEGSQRASKKLLDDAFENVK
jgi:hypothetical protein